MRVMILTLALAMPGLASTFQPNKKDRSEQILRGFAGEFITITPGTGKFPPSFIMGSKAGPASEQPAHKVTFSYPFSVAKYEVTQELYAVVMGNNPSRWKGPRNALEKVSWDEAKDFCSRVTKALRERKLVRTGETIRLPSEAEWEYVCRAGTSTRYSFGDSDKELGLYGWFTGNAKGNDPPVGAKRPNPWELYDMHGYGWEWCEDSWHPDYKDAPADGSARQDKSVRDRVVRGGAWTEAADHCRSAYRYHAPAETRSEAIGFRCVKSTRIERKQP